MDPLDLILAKVQAAWSMALQYFDNPGLIFAVAVLIFIISLTLINRRD